MDKKKCSANKNHDKYCVQCRKKAVKMACCENCKDKMKTYYCSRSCQKKHWRMHKKGCGKSKKERLDEAINSISLFVYSQTMAHIETLIKMNKIEKVKDLQVIEGYLKWSVNSFITSYRNKTDTRMCDEIDTIIAYTNHSDFCVFALLEHYTDDSWDGIYKSFINSFDVNDKLNDIPMLKSMIANSHKIYALSYYDSIVDYFDRSCTSKSLTDELSNSNLNN